MRRKGTKFFKVNPAYFHSKIDVQAFEGRIAFVGNVLVLISDFFQMENGLMHRNMLTIGTPAEELWKVVQHVLKTLSVQQDVPV